jgi:hypothetical protein
LVLEEVGEEFLEEDQQAEVCSRFLGVKGDLEEDIAAMEGQEEGQLGVGHLRIFLFQGVGAGVPLVGLADLPVGELENQAEQKA